jgi:PAS domain S-box-containing protein
MLWSAFAALATLIVVALVFNFTILQSQRRRDYQLVRSSAPLLDAVNTMSDATAMIVSAARGYLLTQQSQFLQQYDDAVRDFEKSSILAKQLATEPPEARIVGDMRRHFAEVRQLTDKQISLMKAGQPGAANEAMLSTARLMRSAPDFAGMLVDSDRREQDRDLEEMGTKRQWLMIMLILASVGIVGSAAFAITRIERSLHARIESEVRRTEAIVAGMADGVMLVDREGNTVFINPAGQKLLGRSDVGVPIQKQSEAYRLSSEGGRPIAPVELPSALALSSGRPVRDTTMMIDREDQRLAISMNATPLKEAGRTTGAIVTFRDVTERRRLEEEMQHQAERAQILADAGGYFASNIDRAWVTQAIAERVAEILGDWSAVILKTGDSNEMRVASLHHRDMSSLGLAWSYIYRQPLAVGEGIIGQVVSTGYPSLTMNLGASSSGLSPQVNETSYHAPSMQLASLLILPLRTRREILGALVIAANDPERVMTDANLPLAEVLAERAALAIENAKLYAEQVDARRKVEDLSRLKDEFLSIASHELRTPVTSIKGYTQLAKTLIRENDLATSEEYLDVALDQIDRMSRLILELLDVSRIETGRLEIHREPIQWSTFLRDIVHHHHTAVSDRHFRLSIPEEGKVILGDRDRLEQVLGNLMENAVKYSPEGSDVAVTIEERGDQVVTSVSDHGIGIPLDELGQVFERFHRGRHVSSTNYGGLGLGLYIAKQIIERHGGSIWVESKEGAGTTFYFSLPLAPVQAQVATETAAHT